MATIVRSSLGLSTRTFPSAPTDGNGLIVAYSGRAGTGVLDGSYTASPEGEVADTPGDKCGIGARLASGDSATIAGSFNNNNLVAWLEVAGLDGMPVATDSSSATGDGHIATSGDIALGDGGFAVMVCIIGSGGGFDAGSGYINAWTPGPGWTKLIDQKVTDGHPETLIAVAYGPGTVTPTATFINDGQPPWPWAIVAAAYSGVEAPPEPGPDIGVSDPGDVFIGDLTEAFDVKFRVELDGTGTGEFKINRHSPEATAELLAKQNIVRVTVPQIDPAPIFAFMLEAGDFTVVSGQEEGGEDLQFSGRGALCYWERAIWLAQSFLIPWWPAYFEAEEGPPGPADIGAISFRAGTYARYTVSGGHASSPIHFTTGGFTAYYDTRRVYTRTGQTPIRLVHLSSGAGTGWYVHPYGPGVKDYKKTSAYQRGPSILMQNLSTEQKPGQVLYKMYLEAIDAARAVHPLVGMTIDFDGTVDSDGNTWTVTGALDALSAALGEDYLATIGKLLQTSAIDVYMDPNLGFHAFNHYGRDLHGLTFGAGKVIFRRTVNIADDLHRIFNDLPVATFAEVTGTAENSIVDVLFPVSGSPDREIGVHGDTDDLAALTALGTAQLNERLLHSDTVAFQVDTPKLGAEDEMTGKYLPGPPDSAHGNYWIGDLVTLDTGDGVHDFDNETARVYGITFEWDGANNLTVTAEVFSGYGSTPQLGQGSNSPSAAGGGIGTPASATDVFQPIDEKDQPTGYAGLDDDGHVFLAELGGLTWKNSVRVAATGDVAVATLDAGDSLDGITLAEGDEVLLPAQTDASENGVYLIQASGEVPTRRQDFDDASEIVGAIVPVREGTDNAGTIWRVTNLTPPVIDTDDITIVLMGESLGVSALDAAVFGYLAHGNTGASETFDASAAGWHSATLDSATVTATFAGATAGRVASMVLELAQDGTGGRLIDFPSSVINDTDLEGRLDLTASASTYYVFFSHDGGTNWIGFVLGVGGTGGTDLDAIIAVSAGQDIADALAGAAAPDAGNVFATMADVGGGGGTIQYPALKPSPPTYDFDGASLDGAFSARSGHGSFTTSDCMTQGWEWGGSSLEMQFSAQEGLVYVAHANTDLDFHVGGIVMHGGGASAGGEMFGIAALDSAGTGVGIVVYNDGNAYFATITTWNYTAFSAAGGFGHNLPQDAAGHWWLRLKRVSGTWTGYISMSGRAWEFSFATRSDSITVDKLVFGLLYNVSAGYNLRLVADYFHVDV